MAEPLGSVAVGLDILDGGTDVGPAGTGNEDAGNAMSLLLRALVGGDDRIEAVLGDEREDAFIEKLQAAEGGMSVDAVVEAPDDAFFAADGSGTGVLGEPAGGEGVLLLPGAQEGGGIEIGDDVGVEEPEGLGDEPFRVAEGAAGAEDDGLEDGGDAQLRKGLGSEVAEERAGGMVEIDQNFADAPSGEPGEGAGEHGAVPKGEHGLGSFKRERAQTGAEAGGENEGFAREHVHGEER